MSRRKDSALLKSMRDDVHEAWEHDRDNRREMVTDLAFIAGDQWPATVRRERESAGRPMLTINRLPQFVRQITNDIRQAELAIKVSPVDDGSDPKLARIYNALLSQIQYQSGAQHVYSAAAEHQAGCGIGWWRIVTDYADDSAFDQEIKIKAVQNPLSVYWDPSAKEQTKHDARYMVVTETLTKNAFKERYPKASIVDDVDFPVDDADQRSFWYTDDTIRIAEYWYKEPAEKQLALMQDGSTLDLSDVPEDMLPMLPIARGQDGKPRIRKAKTHKIMQVIASGSDVLEGPNEWPGRYFPFVPAVGGEWPQKDKVYRYSAIRFARDSQQLYNYARTSAAEAIAKAPKSPWLLTPDMIGPYKQMWDTANTKDLPYMLYRPDPKSPNAAPVRNQGPEVPAAFINEAQVAADDMKGTTGIYDAGLGARSNETSGRAIMARQREGDVGNYHFIDNLRASLTHTGRVLVDLIPKIYDNERVIRIAADGEEEQEEFMPINKVMMGVDGEPVVMNDLSTARFDVRVTIGQSYTTKRMEAADSLLQFMQAVPQAAPLVIDLVAKNFDWPDADKIAKRLKNMVPPQALADPNDPNAPKPPGPLDDPSVQLELREKAAKAAKTEAEAEGKHLENMATYGMMTAAPGIFDQGAPGMEPTNALMQQNDQQMPFDMGGQQVDPALLEQLMASEAQPRPV